MHFHLTPQQAQTLLGLLDIAIKQVGIRAMEDDVVSLMQAVKSAIQPQSQLEEAA